MDEEAVQNGPALDLAENSLEEIVAALIAGRAISTGSESPPFRLMSDDARTLLHFYKTRPDLWNRSKPVVSKEVEDLLVAFSRPAKQYLLPALSKATRQAPAIWTLVKVEAHRFAGLHRHCDANGQAPDIFELLVDRDITCIWGFNGAGKTALQSAILWCLTGRALRSLHLPDEVHDSIDVRYALDGSEDEEQASIRRLSIPPIVPLPSMNDLAVLGDRPMLDTWVQLTFLDKSGRTQIVKRSLQSIGRGRPTQKEQGLSALGVSQLAIEAGTLMPAIAASMRFDEKTTFAAAIAQLTGLKPLADLGRRATRLAKRLNTEEADRASSSKAERLNQFASARRNLTETWERQKEDFGPPAHLYPPNEEGPARSSKDSIQAAVTQLDTVRERAQADVLALLGHLPPLTTSEQVAQFVGQIDEARDALAAGALNALPSIAVAKRVTAISMSDREAAMELLQGVAIRAASVADRLRNIRQAARLQLYARVAEWHHQHHPDETLMDCPVCGTNLDSLPPDAVLNIGVREALERSLKADADATKGAEEWQRDAARELLEGLKESVRSFADVRPPSSLLALYREAFVDELLNQPPFRKQLSPLKTTASALWAGAVEKNPLPQQRLSASIELPQEFARTLLARRFENVQAVIALATQREESDEGIKAILAAYIGTFAEQPATDVEPEEDASRQPLRRQVVILKGAIEGSAPVLALLRQLQELEVIRREWQAADSRYGVLIRAASAADDLARLPDLVHQQVAGLIETLESKTQHWLSLLYRPHYVGGPAYCGIDPSREHGVGLNAGIGDLRVAAHHVMNSSQLRACTWAFLFSLWEHIRANSGGLDVVLLDDPQTYFDPINVENFAAAIPRMVSCGMAPIITSNDNRFVAAIRDKLPKLAGGSPSWTTLQLNPISSSRLTVGLSPSVDEVFERRDAWRADPNDVGKAQQFVERVRLHLENYLWDLLASDPTIIYKPTLADLLGFLGNARNAGEQPFNEQPFARLLTSRALKATAHFYSAINKAHHNLRDITPHDAEAVNDALDEVNRLVRSCSAAYSRFMGRLTFEDEELFYGEPPPLPTPTPIVTREFPLIGDFSARSNSDVIAIERPAERFALTSLGDVVLFAIRGGSLGMLALPGQIVIASLAKQAESGDPVVAIHGSKVLARRYHSDQADLASITLTCDISGTENVAPALMLRRNRTRILPIVGVLYDQVGRIGSNEANPVDSCQLLGRRLLAATIVDDSAYPVIRSGDTVLLEEIQTVGIDTLKKMSGEMVALVASQRGETFAYLKRVGEAITDSMMIFSNVGLNGSALPISIAGSSAEEKGEMLKLQRMWHVRGVIRTRS